MGTSVHFTPSTPDVEGWATGTLIFFNRYALGTETGFLNSSVTNWSFGTRSYQVQLHCTRDEDNGYTKPVD